MSFPKYERYRDSGVGWLGEVPEHWQVKRLRHLAHVQSGVAKGRDLAGRETIQVPYLRVANVQDGYLDLDEIAMIDIEPHELDRYALQPGDVLMNEGGDFDKLGRGHVWRGEINNCIHQNHVFAVRPHGIEPEWLALVTSAISSRSFFISRSKQSTNLASISQSNLQELPLCVPPRTERHAIVAFLDRETVKIDALVDEQSRLIELLKEKRQAVISHTVTKGLDPNALMKASGVEWLGQVPEHWEVRRIGRLFSEAVQEGLHELPVLSVSIHDGVSDKEQSDDEADRKVTRSEDRTKYKRVQLNDLVYNMMRAWQGGFGTVQVEGMVSPAYVVARPRSAIHTRFVEHLLRTPQAVEEMRRHSHGVIDFRLRLYWDEFKNITLAVPPLREQERILAFINDERTKIKDLIATTEISINLLQERRSALISAAVTGKIDVRGAALIKAEAA